MFLNTPRNRAALGLVAAAALALSLSACGEKKSESTPGSKSTEKVTVDQALAGKVPAAIKSDGKIIVGSDTSYAPSEFLDTDGKTAIGFDVDLFNAIAQKLGLKSEFQSAKFADIIPGVQWAAKKGATVNPDDVCGKKVAVQTATVQVDDITARSKKCTDAGKPAITIDQYQAQSDATTAVVSGKDDAMLADSPVCAYAVKQTGGQLALAGNIYDSAPYGMVVAKDQTQFAEALQGA